MKALDYLYFVIYYGNRSKPGDKRFNPAAMIFLTITPVLNALFGLVVGPVGARAPLVQGSQILYARYDVFTYASIAISALIAWRLFDRRRSTIIQSHSFVPTRTVYWSTAAVAFCFMVASTYLSTRSSVSAVIFACVALAVGSILAKQATVESGQGN
jgi:hypothetical protein